MYSELEVLQLKRQIPTLSLGLFIIRLPNPDDPSGELLKYYAENKQEDEEYLVTPSEALNLYEELFVVDSESNSSAM